MELIITFIEGRKKWTKKSKKLLEEEIKTEIKDLSRLAIGSDEKSDAIEGLAKLYKLIIEETKIELDSIDKYESRNSDEQLKREQLSEQIKARDIEEENQERTIERTSQRSIFQVSS